MFDLDGVSAFVNLFTFDIDRCGVSMLQTSDDPRLYSLCAVAGR